MKKRSFLFLLLAFTFCLLGNAKPKDTTLSYDIECAGSGNQGYYLVRVRAYVSKSSEIGPDIVCKCAVHGVLFKGFNGSQGCTSQRPLAGSPLVEQEKADFFNAFFSKSYTSYANLVAGSLQTERVGKQYKVIGVVSVAKDQLRKDLEKAGVIRGLTNGF